MTKTSDKRHFPIIDEEMNMKGRNKLAGAASATMKELSDLRLENKLLREANTKGREQSEIMHKKLAEVEEFINNREMSVYMQIYTAAIEAGAKNPAHLANKAIADFNLRFGGKNEKPTH